MMVIGRTAPAHTACSESGCWTAAVSTFLIADGEAERHFGHACESHIIAVHERAEKAANPQRYQRGTKLGRVNMSRVEAGARILTDAGDRLILADRKTDAMIATVTGKRRGGYRSWILITDLGEIEAPAAQAMWYLA